MSGDLSALQAIWPTLTGSTTAQKMSTLNTMQVPGPPVDVALADLIEFLNDNNILNSIQQYCLTGTNSTALVACNYICAMLAAGYPIMKTSVPATYEALLELGQAMTLDPATGVTTELLAGMMLMVTPLQMWWQVHGFNGAVVVNDLIAAGNLF